MAFQSLSQIPPRLSREPEPDEKDRLVFPIVVFEVQEVLQKLLLFDDSILSTRENHTPLYRDTLLHE